MEAFLEAGKEKVVFEEFSHISYTFQLRLSHGCAGEPDGGHGGGLVVSQALLCHLDVVVVVIDGFVISLSEIGKVGKVVWADNFGS
jgi:hypothetical protein